MRFLCTILLLVSPAVADVVSIGLTPSSQSVSVGGSASVNLVISGLVDLAAPSLGAYDLVVSFDPAILAATGATIGDPLLGNQLDLFGLGSLNVVDISTGQFRLQEVSLDLAADLDSLQAGSFTIAVLNFDVIGPGTSTLSIGVNSLGDSLGNPLSAVTTTATISTVPEPGSLWLPALVLGVAIFARNQRSVTSLG